MVLAHFIYLGIAVLPRLKFRLPCSDECPSTSLLHLDVYRLIWKKLLEIHPPGKRAVIHVISLRSYLTHQIFGAIDKGPL